MVSKEQIQDIKQAVNIVDVIGEVVQLTKAGRNFLGLCPFHGEKTPSFNVVEDKQFYHCFGCGKSGDVFKFIEDYRGIPFMESVQVVAEKAGLALEVPQFSQVQTRQHQPHQVLYDIHTEANKFYHALLMTTKMGEAARAYLHQRGLTDEVMRYFQLGLAPAEPNYLYQALAKKFDEADLLASGLFHASEGNQIFDAFQGRILFPLMDDQGRVVAFSGRIWRPEDVANKQLAKYKNSRSTPIFNKSYELYHLDKAKPIIKKQQEVYLMEGFLDVIAAYRAGLGNAVASMGTALTADHVRHLSKYCRKVIITYDGDKAGQAATAKALEELQSFDVQVVSLPEQMDPDEFARSYSLEALHQALTKSRISQVEFLIDYLKPENVDNLQMQIAFVEKMAPLIAKVQSITAQNSYIYKIADVLPDFDYQQVEHIVNQLRLENRQQQSQQVQRFQATPKPLIMPQARISPLVRVENQLLYRLQEHAYLLNEYRLRDDFGFATQELQVLFALLKKNGRIDSYDLAQESEQVQRAWYQVLEERLPKEMHPLEMQELEQRQARELAKRDSRLTTRQIREKTHIGNEAAAVDDLQRLIEQKRKME